jgi:hypothetical protein
LKTRFSAAGRLAAYSTAAAATSLAAEQAAGAVVRFLPAGGPVVLENLHGGPPYSSSYGIDVDGDGSTDFTLDAYLGFALFASFSTSHQLWMQSPQPDPQVALVAAGETIGPTFPLQDDFGFLEAFQGTRGFVGVRFNAPASAATVELDGAAGAITPGIHYAYLDIAIDSGYDFLTYYGGAYESETNTPIVTAEVPEPGTLGLLALGAAGLAAWRWRRQTATSPTT